MDICEELFCNLGSEREKKYFTGRGEGPRDPKTLSSSLISQDRLWSVGQCRVYFPRLTRDSALPTGLVLLSQVTRGAQMFWDHLSLQLLRSVAREQKHNAAAGLRPAGSGEEQAPVPAPLGVQG